MNIYIAVAIPIMIAFALSVALGPVIIPFLRKLKFGQTVRDDGLSAVVYLYSMQSTACDYSVFALYKPKRDLSAATRRFGVTFFSKKVTKTIAA